MASTSRMSTMSTTSTPRRSRGDVPVCSSSPHPFATMGSGLGPQLRTPAANSKSTSIQADNEAHLLQPSSLALLPGLQCLWALALVMLPRPFLAHRLLVSTAAAAAGISHRHCRCRLGLGRKGLDLDNLHLGFAIGCGVCIASALGLSDRTHLAFALELRFMVCAVRSCL